MKPPLISVVVPAYNAESTIGACLDALLTQSAAPDEYEIVVVDDGSTDGTAQVIKDYAVTVICQPNAGPASAKNRAVGQAQGEIVLFTDADCVPAADWIEARLSVLPFWLKAVLRDPMVGLISPTLLLIGTAALALGLGVGMLRCGREALRRRGEA